MFANKALSGNFTFDEGRFIVSPLFPIFAALHKILFGKYWNFVLIISQISLSSLSGVYLYKISDLVFKNEKISLIAIILYGLFPLTFWHVHTFSQETLFQCLFIFSIYHLIVAYQSASIKSLILFSVLFSLAYLTKSHILLFALFIPLIFIINLKSFKTAFIFSLLFAFICLLFSLPYGLYNKFKNNTYVLSSNGGPYQIYLGNTNAGYITVVEVPQKGSPDYMKMKDINVTAGYFNGSQRRYDSIIALPQRIKQGIFLQDALTWIKNNQQKWIKMKIFNLGLFLMPGVSYRHYPKGQWLMAFILSFPLYLLAYSGIIIALKKDFKTHFYFFAIFLSMLLFSIIFYAQNRFRTITLEPFLLIYAAYACHYFYTFYQSKYRNESL